MKANGLFETPSRFSANKFFIRSITVLAVFSLVISNFNLSTIVRADQGGSDGGNSSDQGSNDNKDHHKSCDETPVITPSVDSVTPSVDNSDNHCTAKVVINKVWQNADGQTVDAPENKGNITITVAFDDKSTDCTYTQADLNCDKTIKVKTPDTINISETGIPAGWEVDQSTIGDVQITNCNQIQSTDQIQNGDGNHEGDNNQNLPTCVHTVINKQVSRSTTPNLHFIKVVCNSFSDVAGNTSANSFDATGGKYNQFSNYSDGSFSPSPLVDGAVNPSEIPNVDHGCHKADGWTFKLDSTQSQNTETGQQVGPTVNGEFVTPISGQGSVLNNGMQAALTDGHLWVSEIQQTGYDFAAIRCYKDALNGDNLEVINLGENHPSDIYCIAYNITQARPCVESQTPVAIVSDSNTQTAGWTDVNPVATPRNPALYTPGTFSNSVVANPVIPPWVDPSLAPFAASGATWISTTAAHPGQPGGQGTAQENQWRLFQYKFTVPAGASVTPGTIYYTADNATTVYLNGNAIADTNPEVDTFADTPNPLPMVFSSVYSKTFTPVAGQENVLEFVLRNSSFDTNENPTALLYKADFSYTNSCQTGFSITGNLYNDQNGNDSKDSGEPGLSGWSIKLFKYDTATDSTTPKDNTTSDVNGDFGFHGLPKDCYILTEDAQSGWGQTQPNVPDHTYYIALGGQICPGMVAQSNIMNWFIKTAQASTLTFTAYANNAVLQNFGNVTTNGGGCAVNCGGGGSTGGGSNGGGDRGGSSTTGGGNPPGRVLGDSTEVPSDPGTPQVLGASTELPRTGTPISLLLTIFATLGILMIPAVAGLKKDEEELE